MLRKPLSRLHPITDTTTCLHVSLPHCPQAGLGRPVWSAWLDRRLARRLRLRAPSSGLLHRAARLAGTDLVLRPSRVGSSDCRCASPRARLSAERFTDLARAHAARAELLLIDVQQPHLLRGFRVEPARKPVATTAASSQLRRDPSASRPQAGQISWLFSIFSGSASTTRALCSTAAAGLSEALTLTRSPATVPVPDL